MTDAITVALITGGLAVVGNVLVAMSSNSKTLYLIEQMEKKVEKHNHLIERVVILEQSDKAQWKYIDQFKENKE